MADAKINESCIIGLPTCGYAFASARMAFIAAPADEEFQLELDILTRLLQEKDYEAYVALQRLDPGKFAFCTKICSKIITSQFCIVLLNSSSHRDQPAVKISNPNVHLEFGLMLAFRKYVLPFQREGDSLAFNVRPLDTIMYTKRTFQTVANQAIDSAILAAGTTPRPTRAIASNEVLMRYLAVRSLRFTDISSSDGAIMFRLGSPLGFNLLDGTEIVYFGMFDLEPAREIVFRLKLLLQNLDNAYGRFESATAKSLAPEALERARTLLSRIKIEALVSNEIDRDKVAERVKELTTGFVKIPWELLTLNDIQARVDKEYASIGDL